MWTRFVLLNVILFTISRYSYGLSVNIWAEDSHVLAVPSLPTSTCWRTTFPRKILSLIWALRLAWWLKRISLSICNNSMISGVSSFPYEFLTNSLGPHSVTELSEGKDLWTTFSLRNQSSLIWPGAGTRTEWREGRSRSSDIFPGRWIWRAPCYEARLKAITKWRDAGRHNLFLLSPSVCNSNMYILSCTVF